MKKIITICLLATPFLAIADEINDSIDNQVVSMESVNDQDVQQQENTSQETPSNETNLTNESPDDVALNFPNETLSHDLINETSNLSNEEVRRTFPVDTTLGYNLDNADSKYFLQFEGTDNLNESKTRTLNFLVKVPYFQRIDSSNKLGVVPDKFKVNFSDPLLNIHLGDNKFNLSPLTIKELEKRGAFINLNYKERAGISATYLLNTPTKDKNPSNNLGASFYIKPISFLKLSTNFLYTEFDEEKFSIPVDNYTYSVRSTFSFNKKNKLDLEAASTNKMDKDHLGYLASLDGSAKNFTYLINYVYANPYFIGNPAEKIENTFIDRTKLDGLVKYNIKDLSLKANHIFEKYNFNALKEKEHAKRTRTSEFAISYPIFHVKTTLGVKSKELKNLLNKDGYNVDALGLDLSIPIKQFCIDTSAEVGYYKSRLEDYSTRTWQGYKLLLKYSPTDNSNISVYTKIGNHIYEDIFTVTYLAGSELKIKFIKNLDLSCTYEYSSNDRKTNYKSKKDPNWKSHYLKEALTYTLPNNHKISISSRINKPLEDKREKEFLFTYTMPFEVPNINRAMNSIRNIF